MSNTYTVRCKGNNGFDMEFTIVADSEAAATTAALTKCERITEEKITKVRVAQQ